MKKETEKNRFLDNDTKPVPSGNPKPPKQKYISAPDRIKALEIAVKKKMEKDNPSL